MADPSPSQFTPLKLPALMQGLKSVPVGVVHFLEASEHDLIEAMVKNGCWTGPIPPSPISGVTGEAVFGLVPYFLHNPPAALEAAIEALPRWVQDLVEGVLSVLKDDVSTQFDPLNYQNLLARVEKEGGIVGDDGTLYGTARYEALDPGWLWAVLNHLYTEHIGLAPYKVSPPPPIPLRDNGSGQVTIALVGDWGTGPYALGSDAQGPSLDVIEQLMGLKPDYLIHLGDVYYSGTPNISDLEDLLYAPWHEEQDHLLGYWPTPSALPAGHSFALNSNHEMYAGGLGYFNVALADSRFSAQAKSSVFALTYGGWTLLGLDSAYFDPSPMDMIGSFGGPDNQEQAAWINSLGLDPASCIVLTHHAPMRYDGSALETFTDDQGRSFGVWPELTDPRALGAPPAAWYYGHLHNGIIYNAGKNATNSPSLLRCLGNGALPYGNAPGLASNPSDAITYYYQTPNPSDPDGLRVYNGFAILTLYQSGAVREDFYRQGPPNGTPTIVFSSTYQLPSRS